MFRNALMFFTVGALFGVVSCTVEEEATRVVGGICDLQGATACDDEMTVVLECGWDLAWQVKEYCANGCTEELGYAQCIGGESDTWAPDTTTLDTDNQLPDTAEQEQPDLVKEDISTDDGMLAADDAFETEDDAVTDDVTVTDDATAADDGVLTDDTAITDDATATDDITLTDDAAITDDAMATDEDIMLDDTPTPDEDGATECASGWVLNESTGSCYRYFPDTKSFEDAETACVAEQGHLVNVGSSAENDWVRDNLGIPANTPYWLGYTAKDATGPGTGSANGNSCSSAFVVNSAGGTYSLNTANAPTSSSGCLCSGTTSGRFVSFRLNNPETGYWEIVADTNNDAVITIHENPSCTSCTTNRKACVDNISTGGKEVFNNQYLLNSSKWYVIMITGKTSNVTGTLYIRPPITSANFATQYVWTDGVSHTYHNFAAGQPDYANGNERCAQVSAAPVWGEWADTSCTSPLPYICEKSP